MQMFFSPVLSLMFVQVSLKGACCSMMLGIPCGPHTCTPHLTLASTEASDEKDAQHKHAACESGRLQE